MAESSARELQRWGEPISHARKAELDARVTAWEDEVRNRHQGLGSTEGGHIESRGPLAGVHISGADVFWLAARFRAERSPLRLDGANLSLACLDGADLSGASLRGAVLVSAHLASADLQGSHLEQAALGEAHLEGAFLRGAYAAGASFASAHLDGADLTSADLREAVLGRASLAGADLTDAHLDHADCTGATFDKTSRLNHAHLDGIRLDQVIFDNTNLTVVGWDEVRTLGDEFHAAADPHGAAEGYRSAGRAYRALSVALRNQGLARDTTRFHYRAEVMDRKALYADGAARLTKRSPLAAASAYGRWLVSWALGTFAGYGDYIGRLFLTYAAAILTFACAMFLAAHQPLSLASVRDSLVLSLTCFHGRGLQPPSIRITDTLAVLAGIEAIFGLLIEGLFIAAFTRRVMGS